ncbi:MAG: FG-GAP repeat domain-containing protein [Gammaproteobacteria bacterium]
MRGLQGSIYILILGASLCYAAPACALAPGATIATADMDGDGIPDLVVLSPADCTVNVVTVDADGNFTLLPPQSFEDITDMSSIAVADVNGDGIPDVIISDESGSAGGVRVLLNDGHGDLAADVSYASETGSGSGPASVTITDINGDGFPDIITANASDGSVSILLNNGDATFAAPVSYLAGTYAVTVAVADLNGDGLPDLVVTDAGTNSVQVLLNDGHGGFGAPLSQSVGAHPVALVLDDIDGDGKPDVLVADRDDNTVGILLGNGDGSFKPAVFIHTGAQPGWLAAQDLDGDGRPDLVTDNYSDGSVSVFTNTGRGEFGTSQRVYPAYGSYDTVVMDIASKPQLVSANVAAGVVVVTPTARGVKQGGGNNTNGTGNSDGSNPPPSTTHPIKGAQNPQSSSGSGAFDLLSLLLLGLLGLSRRLSR